LAFRIQHAPFFKQGLCKCPTKDSNNWLAGHKKTTLLGLSPHLHYIRIAWGFTSAIQHISYGWRNLRFLPSIVTNLNSEKSKGMDPIIIESCQSSAVRELAFRIQHAPFFKQELCKCPTKDSNNWLAGPRGGLQADRREDTTVVSRRHLTTSLL
jgi:hypothetical protein